MPRLVIHDQSSPAEVKTKSGDSVWICRCGLTVNEDGTCSGKHNFVKDEEKEKLYCYDEKFQREEVDDCHNCRCHQTSE